MVLDPMPLPPLDGGRILVNVLPHRLAYNVARSYSYGLLTLIVLLLAGVPGFVLWPLIHFVVPLVEWSSGVRSGVVFGLPASIG
jgi:Zn-dependent protease